MNSEEENAKWILCAIAGLGLSIFFGLKSCEPSSRLKSEDVRRTRLPPTGPHVAPARASQAAGKIAPGKFVPGSTALPRRKIEVTPRKAIVTDPKQPADPKPTPR